MFQDFVVLGIIPGTNFSISFEVWLTAICVGILAHLYRSNQAEVHMTLMIWRIRLAILTRQFEIR